MKKDWPGSPFSTWGKKPDISSLRAVASHLQGKTETFMNTSGSGYRGSLSEMEQEIRRHIDGLEQQVSYLTEVVQGLLEITDDQRPSERLRRVFSWVVEKANEAKKSKPFKILAALVVLTGLVGAFSDLRRIIISIVVWLLHSFKR